MRLHTGDNHKDGFKKPKVRLNEISLNEGSVSVDVRAHVAVMFIGIIRTPWADRLKCARQGRLDGSVCEIEIFEPWHQALTAIESYEGLEVLCWLQESRRDLVLQSPASDGKVRSTFALRPPVRPNPISTSIATLAAVEKNVLKVRWLDCLDGMPLVDLKPDRTLFTTHLAPSQTGALEKG